ncbi:MAG: thioredoxin [Cytophagaceae bacterium]|nr:thioredoxin [Cytophagaceae bacterium]
METKTKFLDLIENSEIPVLVDFYADWCGPCQTMGPMISEIASEFEGRIKVVKVNIDKNHAASSEYSIVSIPTLILFHKGNIKWRESGVVPMAYLKKILSQF